MVTPNNSLLILRDWKGPHVHQKVPVNVSVTTCRDDKGFALSCQSVCGH